MTASHPAVNESAATFKWLTATLGLDVENDASPVRSAWNGVRAGMLMSAGSGQHILQSVDWISDYWVARGAVPAIPLGQLAPAWMPPAGIDQWPLFEVEELDSLFPEVRRSNYDAFIDGLRRTALPGSPEDSASAALDHYLALKSALVPRVFDVPAIQTEHVRVWLASAVGHMLMSAALTPADLRALAQNVLYRLGIPLQIAAQRGLLDQIADRHLEVLYNARMGPDGRLQLGAVRIGQGEEWRDHWLALGFDLGAEDGLEAVQLAARLMRCPALVLGLTSALASEGEIRTIAVAVVRRWLLVLQAMAWLEDALPHEWSDVRVKDLCAFAFNATKPDWPRRVVAVSHRSRDVKPELRGMQAYRAGRFAIDANYVPSWETNVGMIWGLFAATPAIARIESAGYRDSLWCRRERELTEYLVSTSDFLAGRRIVDLARPELRTLDAIVRHWNERTPRDAPALQAEFPTLTEICSPGPLAAWETVMLRAAAALRLIHAIIPGVTPAIVNALALRLQEGGDVPIGAPTNNPDGWRGYADIFRDARETSGAAPNELAVRLPDSYDPSQTGLDRQMAQRIPDLQAGTAPLLRDVLVAMEWLRVEFPQFVERGRGDFLAINCQQLSRDVWETAEEVSLHRGLAAMRPRLPVPLWIVQLADQDVEFWPQIGEVPIFTEHVTAQFAWMLEGRFGRSDSQRLYAENSGLILSPGLDARCRGSWAAGRDADR
jgi:hypothetical protein